MHKYLFAITISFLMITSSLSAQNQVRVSGFVKDELSGERLIGANIIEAGTGNGVMADYNGYFSMVIKTASSLQFSHIGYKSLTVNYNLSKDTLVNISLVPDPEQLDEVVVTASRTARFNVVNIDYNQMVQIPSLGGKPDVIKSLHLMPGISSQNEGSSLMLVRGGDPGQNLYLFDNIPVIYVNHLGGFTSVFNPDIINNIDVYKGGFPSRYGGKLSSVVDITQKEGDNSKLKGSLGIGVTDISFALEGPLKFKNTSFILTGRKTLTDPLLALASSLSGGSGYIISYGFHDINGKFTWKTDSKNTLSLNLYQGDDYLNYWSSDDRNSEEKYRLGNVWGNWLVSARWNSLVSSKLYSSNSISFVRYRLKEFMRYSLTNINDTVKYNRRYQSSVRDISYRSAWKYNASKNWVLDFGIQSSLLTFLPDDIYQTGKDIQQTPDIINSLETALYADNKISFLKNNALIPGIRIVNYTTRDYSDFSLEPRLSLNIAVNDDHMLNASFMRVTQNSHLIFTTGAIMNNEVWIPAGNEIPAAQSDQFSLGWNGGFIKNRISSELNIYYKKMYNLSALKEGYASLMGDENWITKVETGGKGESKGIELLLRKNSGKWTGFVSYALSKTTRQYPGINEGLEYVFDYDRPNMLSVNASYKFSDRLTFNLLWVYQTGLPYTAAIGRQYVPSMQKDQDGNYYYYEAMVYGERNSSRMKDYHRLDLGLSYSTFTKRNNKAVWNFSLYNAYNRHNPNYYYYNTNKTGEIYNPEWATEFKPLFLYQFSLFPVIPTVSYKVYFDGNSSGKNIRETGKKQKSTFKQKFNNWLYHKN